MPGDGPKRKRARIESSSESSEDNESAQSNEESVASPDSNSESPVETVDSPSQNPIHQVIHEASTSYLTNHCPRLTAGK